MSKKMWNKIFKSKTNKNSKTLQAANKINKRSSIYEEYQQLNAALDIMPINNEKFKENSKTPPTNDDEIFMNESKKSTTTKIPQPTTFSKVVNSLTLKRSQSTNGSKDLKNSTGNGNGGKEKNCKNSELKNVKAKSTTSLTATSSTTSTPLTLSEAATTATSSTSWQTKNQINHSTTTTLSATANNTTTRSSNCNSSNNFVNITKHEMFSGSNSNSNFNTPSYNASLNQQKLTENATNASLNLKLNTSNDSSSSNSNNLNNNEYLACKQNLTNPSELLPSSLPPSPSPPQQQKRFSKIIIVVKKLDASTTAETATTVASTSSNATSSQFDLNNQILCLDDCTNNSFTNKHFNNSNIENNSSTTNTTATTTKALETTTATTSKVVALPQSKSSLSLSAINTQNQLSVNLHNVFKNSVQHSFARENDVIEHYHLQNEDRKLDLEALDNGNNITTPTEEPETNASLELVPCPICSRTFNPVTLRKHVGICEKMAMKKRNVFDSSRQRREGTDLATYPLPKNYGLPEKATSTTSITAARSERGHSPKPLQQVTSPILTRKKPTEDLIRSTARTSMRKAVSNNNSPASNTTGSSTTSTTPTTGNFSRDRMRSSERSLTRRGIQPPPAEQCPHCERCFGIKAYDRHVEWCKEKALQAAIKLGNSKNEGNVAKARLEARTKYKAPCLKTKRSLNREKYSGAAGEENDNDDASKSTKSNGSKTQDLMSMSMTSSMCSERNNTNCITGNINEAVAITKVQKNISSTQKGSRKCTLRDKSQTTQLQPTTTTTIAEITSTTTTVTKKEQKDKEEQQQRQHDRKNEKEEPIINLDIQMPEFHLMAEQMTLATAINKKSKTKNSKTKFNALTAAKIKPLKHHHQQQQQLHDFKDLQIYRNKSNQNLKSTTDVQINLPAIGVTLEQKKSASDLSPLKTKCGDKRFQISSCKVVEINNNDHNKYRNYCVNNVSANSEGDSEAANIERENNVDFTESLTDKISQISKLEINGKQISGEKKITMEEYFDMEDVTDLKRDLMENCNSLENKYLRENMINNIDFNEEFMIMKQTYSEHNAKREDHDNVENHVDVIRSNSLVNSKLETTFLTESENHNKNLLILKQQDHEDVNVEDRDSLINFMSKLEKPRSPSKQETTFVTESENHNTNLLILKQQDHENVNVEDYDNSEDCEAVRVNNSLMLNKSILNSPGSPAKLKTKVLKTHQMKQISDQFKILDLKDDFNNAHFIKTDCINSQVLILDHDKTSKPCSDLTEFQRESEIFKDCLTDSDELRRQNKTIKENSENQKNKTFGKEFRNFETKDESNQKSLKRQSKSLTVIGNLAKSSDELMNIKAMDKELLNLSKISENIKSSNAFEKQLPERNDKTRPVTPLTLPRLHSPPPPSPLLSRTTPNTPDSGKLRIKSLNITQPKRKKLLRQSASCSSSLPMKALVPFWKESLETYGVTSPAHSTLDNKEEVGNGSKDTNEKGLELEKDNCIEIANKEELKKHTFLMDKEIKVIKEPPPLKRNRSFTIRGLPDSYDPFLSAKRQLEELCSPTTDSVDVPATPQTPQLPSLPATPNSNNKMTTSLILCTSTPTTTIPNLMTTSQIPQQTQKTPTLTRSSSFRRTSSLRGPRRSPMLSARPPLFAQKHRPTIQRGLSDEGPISTNFLKPEEYDEMPVRSVCVNDFAVNKSPRVVRRDTSTSNRKQPLKLNINAANANSSSASASPNVMELEGVNNNTNSKYVSKTDSLAVFLKYEHELEKLNIPTAEHDHKKENVLEVKTPSTTNSSISTPLSNLDGPLNAKELKDKSNNLSKQNSAKNIKADILLANDVNENYENNLNVTTANTTNDVETTKYNQVRLTPLNTKPSTPLTNSNTTQQQQQQHQQHQPTLTTPLTPLNVKNSLTQNQEQNPPKSPKPVALSSIFGSDNKTTKQTNNVLYTDHKTSDYIDPKLINKCDNLPINLNLKRTDFKHSDSDASEIRPEHFSSSSSESSAPSKKSTSLQQNTKFLPTVKQQQQQTTQPQQNQQQQQELEMEQHHNLNHQTQTQQPQTSNSTMNSQRNSAEGRNLLKRRMRLGRNQFLYDASPEGDSCSADDEGANRSSMEGEATQRHRNILREHEKAFERLASLQVNPIDAPFIPPLPAFDDFDFEEFLSSFENDEEQFPLFKDCREFLMNRTSKKQRSMVMPNSTTQNTTNLLHNNNSTNFKKSPSPSQTFPPLTPQTNSATTQQHFQFPALPQHPKSLFNSFALNARSRNKYDELTAGKTMVAEDFNDMDSHSVNQKREIFISIETEENDLNKSPISPNSIRNMVGNPQTVVEVEVDAAHDNKFSKISDDDTDTTQNMGRSKNFPGHLVAEHLPNVQLNNAKNLIQQMQEEFRHVGDEISSNLRLQMEHRTAPLDVNMNANSSSASAARNMMKMNRTAGTPSGDAYGDSDELSSLDGYPLSSPNSRLGVSSKTSADSAYGSLSRQRSSELSSQRNSSRCRPMTANPANTLLNRPLTEETSLGRSRQLSASSSSSSEHALPPITKSNSYHKQQQFQQQQQQFYNNNNNIANDIDDMMRYEHNNNYDLQPTHPSLTGTTNSHSNLESLQQYNSNSTMSTSMKMSKFCHECGTKFLLDSAKFCMDCGVKRIVL